MNDTQIRILMHQAENDEIYQEILYLRSIYEPEFNRIVCTLPPNDQHTIKMYLTTCVEAEARLSHIAYFLTPEEAKKIRRGR